jgi:thioredoxin-related protein
LVNGVSITFEHVQSTFKFGYLNPSFINNKDDLTETFTTDNLYNFASYSIIMKNVVILFFALTVSLSALAQTKKEGVHIYNPQANAQADIDAAVAKAKKENKHVLVQVGGNWCIWCIRFHNLLDSVPELKTYLNKNYEMVLLNWSPENKNEAILKKFKYPGRFGFPVFLVLDGDGQLIHTQNSAYLEEGKGHSPKKIMDFLKNWNYAALLPENNKR